MTLRRGLPGLERGIRFLRVWPAPPPGITILFEGERNPRFAVVKAISQANADELKASAPWSATPACGTGYTDLQSRFAVWFAQQVTSPRRRPGSAFRLLRWRARAAKSLPILSKSSLRSMMNRRPGDA